MMEIRLRMDPKLVWKLSDDAESSGMNLSQYISFLAELKGGVKPKRLSYRVQQIIKLHSEGLDDGEIAERADCVRAYVTQTRRKHGLASNKQKRKVA